MVSSLTGHVLGRPHSKGLSCHRKWPARGLAPSRCWALQDLCPEVHPRSPRPLPPCVIWSAGQGWQPDKRGPRACLVRQGAPPCHGGHGPGGEHELWPCLGHQRALPIHPQLGPGLPARPALSAPWTSALAWHLSWVPAGATHRLPVPQAAPIAQGFTIPCHCTATALVDILDAIFKN